MDEQEIKQALLNSGVNEHHIEKHLDDIVGMVENCMINTQYSFDEAIEFVKKVIERVEGK